MLQAADSLNEKVAEIEQEIPLLEERKACLVEDIKRSKIQLLSAQDVRRVIVKFEEVILGTGAPERRAFIRNIAKEDQSPLPSHIEPYYRIPPVHITPRLTTQTGLEPFLSASL